MAATPLVPRTVYLPESLATRFDQECAEVLLRLVSGWAAGRSGGSDAISADDEDLVLSPAEVATIKDAWSLEGWRAGDQARADWVVRKLGSSAREIVASFVRHAGSKGVTGKVVAEEAGYSRGAAGVAPALGHVAGATKKVGRRPMWHYEPGEGGTAGTYRMDDDVASLFERALSRLHASGSETGGAQ